MTYICNADSGRHVPVDIASRKYIQVVGECVRTTLSGLRCSREYRYKCGRDSMAYKGHSGHRHHIDCMDSDTVC